MHIGEEIQRKSRDDTPTGPCLIVSVNSLLETQCKFLSLEFGSRVTLLTTKRTRGPSSRVGRHMTSNKEIITFVTSFVFTI